jgi:hypothetical protein
VSGEATRKGDCSSLRHCERGALVAAARRLIDALPHDLAVMWVRGRDLPECEQIDDAYDELRRLVERSFALPEQIEMTVRTPPHSARDAAVDP